MSNFAIGQYSTQAIGRQEQAHIPVSVVGFWSRDPITIYCKRGWSEKKEWGFSLSVSSGGRDTKVVASDADAYVNYGEALIAACCVIKELEGKVDEIEAFYQIRAEELRQEHAAQEAAKQAAIDADPAMGDHAARKIILQAELMLDDPAGNRETAIRAYRRGTDSQYTIYLRKYNKLICEFGGKRISKQAAIAALAMCSARVVE